MVMKQEDFITLCTEIIDGIHDMLNNFIHHHKQKLQTANLNCTQFSTWKPG